MIIFKRKTTKNKTRIEYIQKFYGVIDEVYNSAIESLTMISSDELDRAFYINLPESFYTPFMGIDELKKSREFMDTMWNAYQTSKTSNETLEIADYGLKNCIKYSNKFKEAARTSEYSQVEFEKTINEWKAIELYRWEIEKLEEIFDFLDSDMLDEDNGLNLKKFAPDFKHLNADDILKYLNGPTEDRENMRKELAGMERFLRKEHRKLKDISNYIQLREKAIAALTKYYETEQTWINTLIKETRKEIR